MLKYFIERKDTNEWFVNPLYQRYTLHGDIEFGSNEWTMNPDNALQMDTEEELKEFMSKLNTYKGRCLGGIPIDDLFITDHEFI